jgi:hypothetical protein
MPAVPHLSERASRLRIVAFLGLSLAILFARRPDQFLHPYIWVEEGRFTLPAYLKNGWGEAFEPLAGYLQFAAKFTEVLAFRLSILWAPEILTAFAAILTLATVCAVAFSPTHLKQPMLCALAVLLVPSDPEVFGTGAYLFWWSGILLLLAVLWREEKQWLRAIFLVIGGLSTPLIAPVSALIALRFAFERARAEAAALALAVAVLVAQMLAMRAQAAIGAPSVLALPDWWTPVLISQKFVGGFFQVERGWGGLAIAASFAVVAWLLRARLDRYFLLLVVMFAVVATTISLRTPLNFIDRFSGPPRYFFYPFALFAWIIVWLGAVAPRPLQAVLAAAVAVSLIVAGPRLSRRHDTVDWRAHIRACAGAESYELPIHYIGSASEMWHVKLTGIDCRALLTRSLF